MSHAVSTKTSTTIRNLEVLCQAAERVIAADALQAKAAARGSVTRYSKPEGVNVGYGNVIQSVADIKLVRGARTCHIALQAQKDKTYKMVYDNMCCPEEAVREVGVVYDMIMQAVAAEELGYQASAFVRSAQGEWAAELEMA